MIFKKQKIWIPIYNCSIIFGGFKEIGLIPLEKGKHVTVAAQCEDKDGIFYFGYTKLMGGSILAHECLHLVHLIFTQKNINSDRLNDEHTAYLLQYIYKQLSAKILYTKSKKRRK